jgi:NADPH-dependent 2,4-dienoyl-CoA reductase/sulfur reductase-like enzyme
MGCLLFDLQVLMIGNDARMNSVGYSDKDHEELEKPTNDPQVNLLLGHEASKLDISAKTVELNDGTVVKFDKCFIATGAYGWPVKLL